SLFLDYSSVYHYTPDGSSVDGWKYYISGILNYEQVYTYLPPHHRMPMAARPGLLYDFISPNGWWSAGRWWSTSEKDISYDENGENPIVLLDQDPGQTTTTADGHNYVAISNFFDLVTQTWVHFNFGYENCGEDQQNQKAAITNPFQKSTMVNK